MHTTLDAPSTGATLFHSRAGSFPLHLCSYALLDENGNEAVDLDHLVVIRVTALNGERFRLATLETSGASSPPLAVSPARRHCERPPERRGRAPGADPRGPGRE